jgi:hypothetical protein
MRKRVNEAAMVLGHYGLAFCVKRLVPRTSLGWLVFAAQLADLLWPILLLTGTESVGIARDQPPLLRLTFVAYPITHSLITETLMGALFAVLFWWSTKDLRGAIVCGLLVPSHWILDVIVHTPDLPLWPGGPKCGLGAWSSLPLTLALETLLSAAGVFVYCKSTRPKDKLGSVALWTFLGLLIAGCASSFFGPRRKTPMLWHISR